MEKRLEYLLYYDRALDPITNCQLQIGSKLFPEYPMTSTTEAFYFLRKSLGYQSSALNNFDIAGYEYNSHKFIIAFDIEKVIVAPYTGMNTKSGDLITLKMKK